MGFYGEWILPPLIDLSMRNKRLRPYRERVAGAAEGRVLDIGIGSGVNLPSMRGRLRKSSDSIRRHGCWRGLRTRRSARRFPSISLKAPLNVSHWRTAAWIRS
jgi:hypothetical protein